MARHKSTPEKPGLKQRRAELEFAKETGSARAIARAERNLARQRSVARDEPAIEGAARPSTLRNRARVSRLYTNEAAHGEGVTFPPSMKSKRQRKWG